LNSLHFHSNLIPHPLPSATASSSLQTAASTPQLLSSSQSSETIPEFFRNPSRSGSLCLIDPLVSPLTAKGPSTAFPHVLNKTSITTTGAGTGGGVIEVTKRADLEYRYPYKSFIPPGERGAGGERGGMSGNQNPYAMNLGANVLLTSPSLVQDMVQVVLTRRKIEEKFNSVRQSFLLFSHPLSHLSLVLCVVCDLV
jgi:hypothetical protein